MLGIKGSANWIEQRELEWSNTLKRKLDLFEETIKENETWLNLYLKNFEANHKKSKIDFFSSTFKTTTAKNRYRNRAPIDVRNLFNRTPNSVSKKTPKEGALEPSNFFTHHKNQDLNATFQNQSESNSRPLDLRSSPKSLHVSYSDSQSSLDWNTKVDRNYKNTGSESEFPVSRVNSIIDPKEIPKTISYIEIDNATFSGSDLNSSNRTVSKSYNHPSYLSSSDDTRNNSPSSVTSGFGFNSDQFSNPLIVSSDPNTHSSQSSISHKNLVKNSFDIDTLYYYDSDNNKSRILHTSLGTKLAPEPSTNIRSLALVSSQASGSGIGSSSKDSVLQPLKTGGKATKARTATNSVPSKTGGKPSSKPISRLSRSESDKSIASSSKATKNSQPKSKKRQSQSLQSTPLVTNKIFDSSDVSPSKRASRRPKSAQSSTKKTRLAKKPATEAKSVGKTNFNSKLASKDIEPNPGTNTNVSTSRNQTNYQPIAQGDPPNVFATIKPSPINPPPAPDGTTVTPSALTSTLNAATTNNWISTDQANIVMAQRLEQFNYEQNKILMNTTNGLYLAPDYLNVNNNPMNRLYPMNYSQGQFSIQPGFNPSGMLPNGMHNPLLPNYQYQNDYQSLSSLINMNSYMVPKMNGVGMHDMTSSNHNIYNDLNPVSAFNNMIQNPYGSIQNAQQSILNESIMAINSGYANSGLNPNANTNLLPSTSYNSQTQNLSTSSLPGNQTSAFSNPAASRLSLVGTTENRRDSEIELNINHHEMLNFVPIKPLEINESPLLESQPLDPILNGEMILQGEIQNPSNSNHDVVNAKPANEETKSADEGKNSTTKDETGLNSAASKPISSNDISENVQATDKDLVIPAKLNLPPLPDLQKTNLPSSFPETRNTKINEANTIGTDEKDTLPLISEKENEPSIEESKNIENIPVVEAKSTTEVEDVWAQPENMVTPKNNSSKLQNTAAHASIIPIGQNSPPEIPSDDEDFENDQDLIYELMGDLPPDASPQTILAAQKQAIKKLKKIRNPDIMSTPQWATTPELIKQLQDQQKVNPDNVFGPIKKIEVEEIFAVPKSRHPNATKLENIRALKAELGRSRQSSGVWTGSDLLSNSEIAEYNKTMGYEDQ